MKQVKGKREREEHIKPHVTSTSRYTVYIYLYKYVMPWSAQTCKKVRKLIIDLKWDHTTHREGYRDDVPCMF